MDLPVVDSWLSDLKQMPSGAFIKARELKISLSQKDSLLSLSPSEWINSLHLSSTCLPETCRNLLLLYVTEIKIISGLKMHQIEEEYTQRQNVIHLFRNIC